MSPLTAVQIVTVPFKPQWQCLLPYIVTQALLLVSLVGSWQSPVCFITQALRQRGGSLRECLFWLPEEVAPSGL